MAPKKCTIYKELVIYVTLDLKEAYNGQWARIIYDLKVVFNGQWACLIDDIWLPKKCTIYKELVIYVTLNLNEVYDSQWACMILDLGPQRSVWFTRSLSYMWPWTLKQFIIVNKLVWYRTLDPKRVYNGQGACMIDDLWPPKKFIIYHELVIYVTLDLKER